MITMALAAYRWWRWRPHCSASRHVLACRLAMPLLASDRRCQKPPYPALCDPGRPRGY